MLLFMPQSPRHLMNKGDEEECLRTLAKLRGLTPDDLVVRIEFLEIKAMRIFEMETAKVKYPALLDESQYKGKSKSAARRLRIKNQAKITCYEYASLITNRSLFKRTTVAVSDS